ncbi:SDR family NAD(P)-dependent oxidoreductase [Kyrpidia spormannii]|uniref:SDR family NAD(P)-dependent oxidoreductase n=1 Tax=Kyrpidia spormannii TaxID=2055160 RepID=UPI0018E42011|nr:SDR family oxidoreductase [Kyrpidia spormannii]
MFKSKKVVVTGAAGVIGKWICTAFARQRAHLCVTDVRSDALAALHADPHIGPAIALHHVTDLRSADSIGALVDAVERQWGAPDIVINNAGIYPSRRLLDVDAAEWSEVMAVNLTAPFLLTQAFARLMQARQVTGCFVNIVSKSAHRPRPGGGPYAVSKAGLAMLTRAFALELAPLGIRVNAVSPGLAPGSEVNALSDEYIATMLRRIPLGRPSNADDVGAAVLYLCSDHAAYITGATLVVDGGSAAGEFELPEAHA